DPGLAGQGGQAGRADQVGRVPVEVTAVGRAADRAVAGVGAEAAGDGDRHVTQLAPHRLQLPHGLQRVRLGGGRRYRAAGPGGVALVEFGVAEVGGGAVGVLEGVDLDEGGGPRDDVGGLHVGGQESHHR